MASFNKVIAMGNLTRDPETRQIGSANTVLAEFGIAMNERRGEKEVVCFVDCKAWGKTAETIAEHLHKGDPILIEGRLAYETWEDKQGGKRSKHTITVDRFSFVGGRKQEQQEAGQQRPKKPSALNSDDIPF